MAPKLAYIVLEKELLNFSETAPTVWVGKRQEQEAPLQAVFYIRNSLENTITIFHL